MQNNQGKDSKICDSHIGEKSEGNKSRQFESKRVWRQRQATGPWMRDRTHAVEPFQGDYARRAIHAGTL